MSSRSLRAAARSAKVDHDSEETEINIDQMDFIENVPTSTSANAKKSQRGRKKGKKESVEDAEDEADEFGHVLTVDAQENPVSHDSSVLTGSLSKLPAELLLDLICRLDPVEVANTLATCCAVRKLSQGSNAQYLYRRLYTAFIERYSRTTFHTIYSPVRGIDASKILISVELPRDSIRSWRSQYLQTMVWYSGTYPGKTHAVPCCSVCLVRDAVLLKDETFRLRLCLECYASNLVTKSCLRQFNLTPVDVKYLPTSVIRCVGGLGEIVNQAFYSATHLMCIAKAENPDFVEPHSIVKVDHRSDRVALVEVAVFLITGASWMTKIPLPKSGDDEGLSDSQSIALITEFYRYIEDKQPRRKNSSRSLPEAERSKKPKNRPIREILDDYYSLFHHAKVSDIDDISEGGDSDSNSGEADEASEGDSDEDQDYEQKEWPVKKKGRGVIKVVNPIPAGRRVYKVVGPILAGRHPSSFPSNDQIFAWIALQKKAAEENLTIFDTADSKYFMYRIRPVPPQITVDSVHLIRNYLDNPSTTNLEACLDQVFLDNESISPQRRLSGQVRPSLPIDVVPPYPLEELVKLVETIPSRPRTSQDHLIPAPDTRHQFGYNRPWAADDESGNGQDPAVLLAERRLAAAVEEKNRTVENARRKLVTEEADRAWELKKTQEYKLKDTQLDVVKYLNTVGRRIVGDARLTSWGGWSVERNQGFVWNDAARSRLLGVIYSATSSSREASLKKNFTGRTSTFGFNSPLLSLSKLYHRGNVALAKQLSDRTKVPLAATHEEIKRIVKLIDEQLIQPSAAGSVLKQLRTCTYKKGEKTTLDDHRCTCDVCWIPGKSKPNRSRYNYYY